MLRATKFVLLGVAMVAANSTGCRGPAWAKPGHVNSTNVDEQTAKIATSTPSSSYSDDAHLLPNGSDNQIIQLATHRIPEAPVDSTKVSNEDGLIDSTPSVETIAPGPSELSTNKPWIPNTIKVHEAVAIALSGNKSLLVLGYVPQEARTFIDSEVAEFDPVLMATMSGGQFDRQLSNFIDSGGLIATNEQRTDFLTPLDRNNLSLSKLLETGATVEAGVGVNYLRQDPVGGLVFLNPFWRSAMNLRLTQPLNRGRGREITLAPLRIAQATHTQSIYELRAQVNATVRDTQLAYWDYKLAWQEYQVRLNAVEDAKKIVAREEERLKLDEGTIPDVRQAEDQLKRFLAESNISKNQLRQSKVNLAQVLGLSVSDASFEIAGDEPLTEVPYRREDGEILGLSRPELVAYQAQIRAAETELRLASNNLRSDIDFRFDYAVTGLERNLDDAFSTTFDHQFNDWIVGLDYQQAVGVRAAYAELRRAKLRLARIHADRERVELEIISDLDRAWNELETQKENLQIQQERVGIARQLLEGRTELYEAGEGTLDLQVRAAASLVDAQLAELASRIAVQQAIVNWEFVTGQQPYVELESK